MSRNIALVHSPRYEYWVFSDSHPTQGRRFTHAQDQLVVALTGTGITFIEATPFAANREELERVHAPHYVDEVINQHISTQWSGPREDLAELAQYFVGGTLKALDILLQGKTKTAVHFPGAKHHAQYDHSSGFCVFNDFAIAADIATKDHGLKVAILDIDAHHGDGTENLTAENPKVLTYSIHEYGIFPGTGDQSDPTKHVYNFPISGQQLAWECGMGDEALAEGVAGFIYEAIRFQPDIIFIACGADGHAEDPLSNLQYTVEGFAAIARGIRHNFPDTPIMMGGAGGYLPDTRTPEVWAAFATNLIAA